MGDTYYERAHDDRPTISVQKRYAMRCELEVQGSTREYPRQIIMCEVQRVELDLGSTATMDDIAC